MNRLTLENSRHVLTLSASYTPPMGGIAQVIEIYSTMYPVFNHVATMRGDSYPKKLLALFSALFKFVYYCIVKDICIVHVHGASANSFWRKRIFICLAKLLGKKVIYHVHGGEFKKFYSLHPKPVKSLINKVDVVVALSNSWRSFFEEELGHQNVQIVENVVLPPSRPSDKCDQRIHFLFLGKLGCGKGIYDLLDTFADNIDALRGKALLHIGGNGEVEKVRQRIRELELEDVVVFEGWVSGDRKIDLLNLADVYILPSYNEGLPISILEAMAYRLPIISTPVGGIPEIVVDNENGFLVEPGDSKALGEAILKMLSNEDFRKSAGKSSFLRVQPYFPDSVLVKLEDIYQELLN